MKKGSETSKHLGNQEGNTALPTENVENLAAPGFVGFQISSKQVLIWLTSITLVLNFVGALGRGIEYLLGITETTPIVHLFHVAEEGNLTTWFSAMLLFISSVILFLIANQIHKLKRRFITHWVVLSVIFFGMSLDEAVCIHEITIVPLRNLFHTSGIFYYAWLLLAIPFLIVLGLFFARFLKALPGKTAVLFIIAAGIYILGAAGMEMLAGYALTHNFPHLINPILITFEELFENVGILVFIFALLSFISSDLQLSKVQFQFC